MNLFSVVYIVLATISFTIAVLHFVAWLKLRDKHSYLLFSIVSLFAGILAVFEYQFLFITDPVNFNLLTKWFHLPLYGFLVSTVLFMYTHFKTASKLLAALFITLWTIALAINFLGEGSLTYKQINIISLVPAFNGDLYPVVDAELNPLRLIADLGSLVFVVFILLATIKLYKKGNKQRSLLVGGSTLLFIVISGTIAPLNDIGVLKIPVTISAPFVFMVMAMSMEIILEIVKVRPLTDKLNNEKNKWQSLLSELQLPVVRVNNSGGVIYVNQYMLELTGYTEEEMLNRAWLPNFIPTEEQELVRKNFSLPIKKGFPIHFQNGLVTSSGEIRQLYWSNIGLYDEKGSLDGLIAVGNDITEKENAYKEILLLKEKLELENLALKSNHTSLSDQSEIICHSDAITYAFEKARQVAEVDSIVLLEGETGVGKGVFANYIHKHSSRSNNAFVAVNCAAIPGDLLESELFGYEKGAFTGATKSKKGRFELANDGTLFLDEIAELPIELQPKLLRVIQDGQFEKLGGEKTIKVNVRVIVATNKILLEQVKNKLFREDLFYRLNVFPITIPPLRKRKEDIPKLIDYFAAYYSSKYNKAITKVSKSTYTSFIQYRWPGNIRELQNLIERAVISASGDVLKTHGLLPKSTKEPKQNATEIETLVEVEKQHILKALKESNWQVHGATGAAEILGINPSTLRSRMKKLNIERLEKLV